jgi:hypothetical protein
MIADVEHGGKTTPVSIRSRKNVARSPLPAKIDSCSLPKLVTDDILCAFIKIVVNKSDPDDFVEAVSWEKVPSSESVSASVRCEFESSKLMRSCSGSLFLSPSSGIFSFSPIDWQWKAK